MDRDEALELLTGGEAGIAEWNRRREARVDIPDLSGVNLSGRELRSANLDRTQLDNANLSEASFFGATLHWARLRGADLRDADLHYASLTKAELDRANLRRATLFGTSFVESSLRHARLQGCELIETRLTRADLAEADATGAACWEMIISDVDLSDVRGLETIKHRGPSTIGIDTLYRSKGKIPEAFLRGCGVPEYLIENQKAMIGSIGPIQFYSCFISYSTKDDEFAERLHSKMRDSGLRVWFAPEDVQGGKKLHEQIDEAIRVYDKLLLVLSPSSMNSEWVKTEIRKARKAELEEKRRKLFPIRLVDFETIRHWECFDADTGKDLGVEVREYFVPDFSNWKDHDSFEASFNRLLNDLKAEESTAVKPE